MAYKFLSRWSHKSVDNQLAFYDHEKSTHIIGLASLCSSKFFRWGKLWHIFSGRLREYWFHFLWEWQGWVFTKCRNKLMSFTGSKLRTLSNSLSRIFRLQILQLFWWRMQALQVIHAKCYHLLLSYFQWRHFPLMLQNNWGVSNTECGGKYRHDCTSNSILMFEGLHPW